MRCLILAIVLALAPLPATAADALILQSSHTQVMDQMTRLVQNGCTPSNQTLVLSDYAETDIARMVREERPPVVVAIGDRALTEAKKIRNVPVVYSMALNADEESLARNVSGVSVMVAPKSYCKLFTRLNLRRVGVIYDRKKTGAYLNRAREAANSMGVELVALQVRSSKQVLQKLAGLQERRVDSLWLLPDSTAVSPETVNSYFEFAQRNNLPVIGFSTAFLTKGALAAVELSKTEISDLMCSKINAVRTGEHSGTSDVTTGRLFFNRAVAEKLRISLPPISSFRPSLTSDG